MAELLGEAKRRLQAEQPEITAEDFEREWDAAWALMIAERAWPHATVDRRQWRAAMIATRSEVRAAFLDRPTMFGTLARSLTVAAMRWHIDLTPEELPRVIIGAIQTGYAAASESTVEHTESEGVLL